MTDTTSGASRRASCRSRGGQGRARCAGGSGTTGSTGGGCRSGERHDREMLEHHYELLRDRSKWRLYVDLRSAFKKHGKAAEAFLLEVFPREGSPGMRADALLLLGLLRSKQARRLAIESITAEDEELRHKACVVLGWGRCGT